jgi:AraC family transcriptional regulator
MSRLQLAAPALPLIVGRPTPSSTDTLGCLAQALESDQELAGGGLRFYRKRSAEGALRAVETPASDRGHLLGLSLSAGHRRRIHGAGHSTNHQFARGSLYVRNFADPYCAELDGAFDFLLVEVPRTALDELTEEAGGGRIDGLDVATACRDDVLCALLQVMVPVLERPSEASPLFLEQLSLSIVTRVADRYGHRRPAPRGGGCRLSRWQEARAKDMLRAGLGGQEVSIADVARACELSRSYFTTAFRQTVGQTPHQWLTARRLEQARQLMASTSLQLADIAAACGFADQSHFTRVFSRATGSPPARWRRDR